MLFRVKEFKKDSVFANFQDGKFFSLLYLNKFLFNDLMIVKLKKKLSQVIVYTSVK